MMFVRVRILCSDSPHRNVSDDVFGPCKMSHTLDLKKKYRHNSVSKESVFLDMCVSLVVVTKHLCFFGASESWVYLKVSLVGWLESREEMTMRVL